MEQSEGVRDAYLGFADRLTAGDVARFDDFVSGDAKLIIGTAPGELVRERGRMRFGFETEGLGLSPGNAPEAWEEGPVGWLADEPSFVLPNGAEVPIRLTLVMRREDELWKIVHGHFSIGVPDEDSEA